MRKIAFTFAGRESVMRNQVAYMRQAVADGLVDEWHVWDFSRNPSDGQWLSDTFFENQQLFSDDRSLDYIPIYQGGESQLHLHVRARNDAHVLLQLSCGTLLEVVFGAHGNTRTLLRLFAPQAYQPDAHPAAVSGVVLDAVGENDIVFCLANGALTIRLNGVRVFELPTDAQALTQTEVHTGHGATGMWSLGLVDGPVRLIKTSVRGYKAFHYVYLHYAEAAYHDARFIKLDDDIVWCDLTQMSGFVDEICRGDELKIVSANVINNGVCAYFQKEAGLLEGGGFDFEYPPNGVCGTLWNSAELCERLHHYFIDHCAKVRAQALAIQRLSEIPLADRFSINLIGFGQPVMIMMAYLYERARQTDDELIMTQLLPRFFGVRKYIYNPFLVAHLSFFKQHERLESAPIVSRYAELLAA